MTTRINKLLAVIVASTAITATHHATGATLSDTIDTHLANVRKTTANRVTVAIKIVNIQSGSVIYQTHPHDPLVPASNMKLFTTFAAMKRLGPDFRFNTYIGTRGDDLVVIGDGDPSVGDPELADGQPITAIFQRIADKLKGQGIGTLSGHLIVDTSRFDAQYRHPNWPENQFHRWYAAPVAALNFNDNCIDLSAGINADGHGQLELTPNCNFIRIEPEFVSSNRRQTVIDAQWSEPWELTARITLGRRPAGPVSIPIDHPPTFFAEVFREKLADNGIRTTGPIIFRRILDAKGQPPRDLVPRIRCQSYRLDKLILRTNKSSQNLFAECLFKRLGLEWARQTGKAPCGSWVTGKAAIESVLRETIKEYASQVVIDDGSGLSQQNRVSTNAIVALLIDALKQPWAASFVSSLAVSAEDGTLRSRMTGTAAAGRVYAKTGSVAGANVLSGFIVDHEHRPVIAFAMLFNNVPRGQAWCARQAQDRICIALVKNLEDGT